MRESISWNGFCPFALLDPEIAMNKCRFIKMIKKAYLGGSADGAAAASAAALAKPWRASIGALREDLGRVSSDSSSEDGAVLGTMP
jgi:hypothetical protein